MKGRHAALILFAILNSAGGAQTSVASRFTLPFEHIASVVKEGMAGMGMRIVDGQVSMPTTVVATVPRPSLDVISIEPLGTPLSGVQREVRFKVKMGCHLQGACVPFYALVTVPRMAGAVDNPPTGVNVVVPPEARPESKIIMRSGTRATLLMNDDRARIQISVISLENGIAGHTIRVSSLDRKQIYFAEVVSASLLKGRF